MDPSYKVRWTQNSGTARSKVACDLCRLRKVKVTEIAISIISSTDMGQCFPTDATCNECELAGTQCVYTSRQQRRGRKRKRLQATQGAPSPTEKLKPVDVTLQHAYSWDDLEHRVNIDLLLDDFFRLIYPLCMFPQEPVFRAAWNKRLDKDHPSFAGLLCSMLAALLSTIRQGGAEDTFALQRQRPADHVALREYCFSTSAAILNTHRGSETGQSCLWDAAACYFLGFACVHLLTHVRAGLFLNDALKMTCQYLHGINQTCFGASQVGEGGSYRNLEIANGSTIVVTELSLLGLPTRIFWAALTNLQATQCIKEVQNSFGVSVLTTALQCPDLPTPTYDLGFFSSHLGVALSDLRKMCLGLDTIAKMFCACQKILILRADYTKYQSTQWFFEQQDLEQALQECKAATSALPSELCISSVEAAADDGGARTSTPVGMGLGPEQNQFEEAQQAYTRLNSVPQSRGNVSIDTQRAYIFVASLFMRYQIVDTYFQVRARHLESCQQRGYDRETTSTAPTCDSALQKHICLLHDNELETRMLSEWGAIIRSRTRCLDRTAMTLTELADLCIPHRLFW